MLVLDNLIYRWQKSGGVSTVWYELTKRIIERRQDYFFLEYANSNNYNHLRAIEQIPADRTKILDDSLFLLKRYFPVSFDLDKPFIFQSSYYRTCCNNKAVNIITVHDFIYERYRKGLAKKIHCLTKEYSISKANYIVCISQSTKNDLLNFYPDINKDNIRIIYNGASDSYHPIDTNKEDYLLFIGARGGYKNFSIAVDAAAKAGRPLIICGKKLEEKEKEYLDRRIPQKYKDLGFVSEEKLNLLYNKAFALIYPSSYEGFGIPVVEAQKAGCPVIAIKGSSIPEVIGNKFMLCDAATSDLILERLNFLKNKSNRDIVIKDGLNKASKFSWDQTYNDYVQLYAEISQAL